MMRGASTAGVCEVRYLHPLSVTLPHILSDKSGGSFTSCSHTGLPVAVLAEGINAEIFNGGYDNTDIFTNLADMLQVR